MKPHRRKKLTIIAFIATGLSVAIGLSLYALSNSIDLFFTPTQVAAGFADDRAFAVQAARLWPAAPGAAAIDADDLLGLMTLTLTLATQGHLMAPELYASTTRLLRELHVARLEAPRS